MLLALLKPVELDVILALEDARKLAKWALGFATILTRDHLFIEGSGSDTQCGFECCLFELL